MNILFGFPFIYKPKSIYSICHYSFVTLCENSTQSSKWQIFLQNTNFHWCGHFIVEQFFDLEKSSIDQAEFSMEATGKST